MPGLRCRCSVSDVVYGVGAKLLSKDVLLSKLADATPKIYTL